MEKANAIFRYRTLHRLTDLFRFIEICIFAVVVSTFVSQLPLFSARIISASSLGEIFISFASFSPRFVFLIGNVIILILLFKSRVVENENGDLNRKIDVYDEYVKSCENSVTICNDSERRRKLTRSVTEMKYSENFGCCDGEIFSPEIWRSRSEKLTAAECKDGENRRKLTRSVTEVKYSKNFGCYGGERSSPEIYRSRSEKLTAAECKDGENRRKLTRSVTDRNIVVNFDCCGGETVVPEKCAVDELSSEAFRRTVEAFISRQQRSLK